MQITYVLIVYINSTKLWKVLRNVSNWDKMTKPLFSLNPYRLGKISEKAPKW